MTDKHVDGITLELLRNRLEAIAEEAAYAIERTAVSPIVAEGKDFSTNIFTARGEVLVGGGPMEMKWASAMNPIRTILERFGGDISAGDVFAANDPHTGGGNHPADIELCQPVFVEDQLVGWVAASAHLIDVGGMAFGSWAPDAVECYQEALRLPPVRLYRSGTAQDDVWAIILNNVRLPHLVEMDIRGLTAGCFVAAERLAALIRSAGISTFMEATTMLCDNADRVLRERIGRIEDGAYSMTGWVEWGDELYTIPCTLTVDGSNLTFDFSGASAQVPHFINSKDYIVHGQIVTEVRNFLGQDLPYCHGLFRPIRVITEPGTIVNASVPAPIASAHIDVAFNTTALAMQCLQTALAASDAWDLPRLFQGQSLGAMAAHSWYYVDEQGNPDGWVVSDGFFAGSAAGPDRDGGPLGGLGIGTHSLVDFVDIEILEAWYPIEVIEKRPGRAAEGAGRNRAGGGCEMSYRLRGVREARGTMFAMREGVPMSGMAGGWPGAPTVFEHTRRDGSREVVGAHATNVTLQEGDVFRFQAGSGGGWRDPLEREPGLVAKDVRLGLLTTEEARQAYGVMLETADRVDEAATSAQRDGLRQSRLSSAEPPLHPVDHDPIGPEARAAGQRLFHGIVQVGDLAVAESSGAVLARAPGHWTDGCFVSESIRSSPIGTRWIQRSYLDPLNGLALHVEAVPIDAPRSFRVEPQRWTALASGDERGRPVAGVR